LSADAFDASSNVLYTPNTSRPATIAYMVPTAEKPVSKTALCSSPKRFCTNGRTATANPMLSATNPPMKRAPNKAMGKSRMRDAMIPLAAMRPCPLRGPLG
jgi:hypothetical protein